jgi:hypothetical protein
MGKTYVYFVFSMKFAKMFWLRFFLKGKQKKRNNYIINTLIRYCQQIEWINGFWQQEDPSFPTTFSSAHYHFYKYIWPQKN